MAVGMPVVESTSKETSLPSIVTVNASLTYVAKLHVPLTSTVSLTGPVSIDSVDSSSLVMTT